MFWMKLWQPLLPGTKNRSMPPNPEITLKPTPGRAYSNYSDVKNAAQSLVAYGGTDIAGALQAAVRQLKPTDKGGEGLSRKGSTKAIVLFTDGLPTASSVGGSPTADARSQAYVANQAFRSTASDCVLCHHCKTLKLPFDGSKQQPHRWWHCRHCRKWRSILSGDRFQSTQCGVRERGSRSCAAREMTIIAFSQPTPHPRSL